MPVKILRARTFEALIGFARCSGETVFERISITDEISLKDRLMRIKVVPRKQAFRPYAG